MRLALSRVVRLRNDFRFRAPLNQLTESLLKASLTVFLSLPDIHVITQIYKSNPDMYLYLPPSSQFGSCSILAPENIPLAITLLDLLRGGTQLLNFITSVYNKFALKIDYTVNLCDRSGQNQN